MTPPISQNILSTSRPVWLCISRIAKPSIL